GEDRGHRHQVRVPVAHVRDLVPEDGLELALGHRPEEPRGYAEVARLAPKAGRERVRGGIVDDSNVGRHRQAGGDRDVLDEAAERLEVVFADTLGARHAGDHRARGDEREERVQPRAKKGHGDESQVEERADQAGDDPEEQGKSEDDDAAPEPVRANLLLESHVANEISGGAVSPSAEKNSRCVKPNGLAKKSHGMLWIAVLNVITVEL